LGGVIFTRAAAQKVIQSITDITSPIDNMLFIDKRPQSFRIIEVFPSVAEPNAELLSDIGARRKIKNFAGKAKREFRRIRNQFRYWRDFLSAWGVSSILRLRTRN
jgi:hypothetical protein